MFVLSSNIGIAIGWFFIKNWWLIPLLIIIILCWKIIRIPLLVVWKILKLPFKALKNAIAERNQSERRNRE